MLDFWQHLPYYIDPVIFKAGFFTLRWYWLMYLLGFLMVYSLLKYRLRKKEGYWGKKARGEKDWEKVEEEVTNSLFWMFLGLLLGARLGYFLFYGWENFLADPLSLINPFTRGEEGWVLTGFYGMSYHGGLLGVIAAFSLYIYKKRLNFWRTADFIVPAIPLGYFFGRMGNFLNGELYGRVTERFWGMYFPEAYLMDGASLLRHPSQIYEAFFEGLALFFILWKLRNKGGKLGRPGILIAFYSIGYGIFRFFIEFYRQPDWHLELVGGVLTRGQILCLGMILVGAGLMILKMRSRRGKDRV